MKWTIDRFEEKFAVIECEDKFFNIPKESLPQNVHEGDILEVTVNTTETESSKAKTSDRLKKLFGE